jgi:predicted transcriptional regulator
MPLATFRIDERSARLLERLSQLTARPKSDIIREALQRQFASVRFEKLRELVAPFAEARGWLSDEDIWANRS